MKDDALAFTDCTEAEGLRRAACLGKLRWYRNELLQRELLSQQDEAQIDAMCRRLLFGRRGERTTA